MKPKKYLWLFLIYSLTFNSVFNKILAQKLTVDNTKPRMDNLGEIVDAHDGRIVQFGKTYYWYGTSYRETNGFTTANHYVCYSSPDLKTWKKEGRLLLNQPDGVYYRPHVIYNQKTKNYVLWFNWYPQLWEGQFGVAISKNPAGPFKILNDDVQMARSELGLGDFGLFVDEDAVAYISYNTIESHQVSIEKLDEKYTASTMENGGVIAQNMEAGSQFKRQGKYYLLTDYTCCFCNEGSGARVYISDNPLSGYQMTGNINRYPGRFSSAIHDGMTTGTRYEILAKKDSIFDGIAINFKEHQEIREISIHLFTGNRPANCGEISNPRVHPKIVTPEFSIYRWDFDEWRQITIESAEVEKSALSEKVTLGFASATTGRLKIIPQFDYPFDAIYVNEVVFQKESDSIKETLFDAYIIAPDIPQTPIIPAQQNYVMALETELGKQYIWMGDLWGSASDNIKGHDYPYWSAPLDFNPDGTIQAMEWTDIWGVKR